MMCGFGETQEAKGESLKGVLPVLRGPPSASELSGVSFIVVVVLSHFFELRERRGDMTIDGLGNSNRVRLTLATKKSILSSIYSKPPTL